jgi:rhodanese-related sulfurtransferase
VTAAIRKDMTMGEILAAFPSAQRALFQKYHVGGCSDCGFEETETLEQVCQRRNLSNIDEVIDHLTKSHQADSHIQISARDAAALLKKDPKAKLIDVRTDEEYKTSRIEGATLVNEGDAVEKVLAWPKDTPLIVYCHHGIRSLDAASYLIGHGFKNVFSMTGGIDAWTADVDPTVPRY